MLYVAYGSNTNLKQMSFRCPRSVIVGNGKLENYRLIFNIHADIIKEESCTVPVVVWKIHDTEWENLDMYEGFPSYYIKEIVPVVMEDGRIEHAIVYVMNNKRKGVSPPYTNYFETCLTGYRENNLDEEYLYDALDYSWEHRTKYNQYYTLEDESDYAED